MIRSITVLIAFMVFFPPGIGGADIYMRVDDSGVIHLTNVPTADKAEYTLVWKEKRVIIDPQVNTDKYDQLIARTAAKYNLDKALIKAVIKAESNFNHRAVSRAGARGLMQLMPATAHALNVQDAFHPESNIEGGVRYLHYLLRLFNGNLSLALAAYNAGEGAVIRYNYRIPPFKETQQYVKRVFKYLKDSERYPSLAKN